ncbi:MAG: ComF family protein [Clostridiales bacterium]|jgi:ComF family protein|nr:ComF family protein [Clostridiales bacterium]
MFKTLINKFLDTLFPNDAVCLFCGRELRADARFGLCVGCLLSLPYVTDDIKVCACCGKPSYNEAEFCLECQNHKRAFERVNSPLIYTGRAVTLVEDLKFYNKKYIARIFAELIATEYLRREYHTDLIVPVPMYSESEKERGYNQSALIAELLAKLLGIEFADGVLVKKVKTAHQMLLGGQERHKNLIGAFAVAEPSKVKGKTVLVIDDVITTGATLNECAIALKKAKASEVFGLTACATEYRLQKELK